MTLMTSAALMYRPERVTFFCIGAVAVPGGGVPHVAGVVSLNDTEGVSRTIATIEGLIRAREASFKQYQIDISEFRERRFGAAGGGGTDPDDKFGDVFLVIDNYGDLYDKDSAMGDRAISIARQGPVVRRARHDQRHGVVRRTEAGPAERVQRADPVAPEQPRRDRRWAPPWNSAGRPETPWTGPVSV